MDQSTFNHGKSGDTNPKGRSRSPLLELYTRSLRNEREEKIGHRTSAACGGRLRLCYTLDEGKESERETTNCPPKRVRSRQRECAGRNASERRASLENVDAQTDPVTLSGKVDTTGEESRGGTQLLRRGSGGSMYTRKTHATREAPRRAQR